MSRTRAPKIDEAGLARHRAKHDRDLTALKNGFLQFEAQREAKEMGTAYIAFEAVAALLGGRKQGYTDEELRDCWPAAWGTSELSLPASLVQVLAQGWMKWKRTEGGKTLGEAFKLEGGGQGKPRASARQKAVERNRKIGNRVVLLYTQGTGLSLDAAVEAVAMEFNLSDETVREAYDKYGRPLIRAAQEAGILKGGDGFPKSPP